MSLVQPSFQLLLKKDNKTNQIIQKKSSSLQRNQQFYKYHINFLNSQKINKNQPIQPQISQTLPNYFLQYLHYFYHTSFNQNQEKTTQINQNQSQNYKYFNYYHYLKQYINNTNLNEKESIFQKIFTEFNSFKQSQINSIQKQILSNQQFQKHTSFTSKLKIINVNPSRHYQVVTIQIHLLSYTLKVQILNKSSQSEIHKNCFVHAAGAFGDVYLVKHQNDNQFAVKCLPFNRKNLQIQLQNKYKLEFLKQTLQQYFLLKLSETLKIGPKIKKIYGFDLVIFQSCIEFSMEVCIKKQIEQNQIQDLKQKMKKIHLLNIVHKDIKTQNIMYSCQFQTFVFIDFGGSQVLKEPIGFKSISHFFGTQGYFGQEMMDLFNKPLGLIDLYYNDLYGLKQSIRYLKSFQQPLGGICQQEIYFQQDESLLSIYSDTHASQIIHLLFHQQYAQISVRLESLQTIILQNYYFQQQILLFFTELGPNQATYKLFNSFINAERLSNNCQQLLNAFAKNIKWYCFDLKIFQWKQKQFHKYQNFYKTMEIIQSQKSDELKTVQIITLNKKNILAFIFEDYSSLSGEGLNNFYPDLIYSNFYLHSFVFLKFCTFSTNLYATEILQKENVVKKYFQKVQKSTFYSPTDLQLIFICHFPKLKKIAQFFQFLAIKIWFQMPTELKGQSLKMIVTSLLFLGYPIRLQPAKLYIQRHFICCKESRQNRMLYFWNFYILSVSAARIFCQQSSDKFLIKLSKIQQNQMLTQVDELMQQSFNRQDHDQIENNSFYSLNQQIYRQIFVNLQSFNLDKYNQFNAHIENLQEKDTLIKYKSFFEKWKYIIQLILSVIYATLSTQTQENRIKLIQTVWQKYKHKKQLRYYHFIYLLTSNHIKMQQIFIHFISQLQKTINCNQISIRICIFQRFEIAHKRRNWQQFKKVANIILQQIKFYNFITLKYISYLMKTVKLIMVAFIDNFQQEGIQSFVDFELFIKIIQKAYKYCQFYSAQSSSDQAKSIKKDINLNSLSNLRPQIKFYSSEQQQITNSLQLLLFCEKRQLKDNQQAKAFIFFLLELLKNVQLSSYLIQKLISFLVKTQKNCNSKRLLIQYLQAKMRKNIYQQSEKQSKQTQSNMLQNRLFELQLFLQKCNKQALNKINLIKVSDIFKQIVSKSYSAKNSYMEIQFYEVKRQPVKRPDLIILVEQVYGKISVESFTIQNIKRMPNPYISFSYFASKISFSNYSIEDYLNIYKFYENTKHIKSFQLFWVINTNNFQIFNALVYCDMKQSLFLEFFLFLTSLYKEYSAKQYIRIFHFTFRRRFKCQCKKCFLKDTKINLKQKLLDIIEHLTINMEYKVTKQNCYMALVYVYCLQNSSVSLKTIKKMQIFINYSLLYLSKYAKKKVLQNIFLFKLRMLDADKVNHQLESYSRKQRKTQMKGLQNYFKFHSLQTLVQLSLKNLNIQTSVQSTNVKSIHFKKKITKYFQVKKNYQINQFNKSNNKILQEF